MLKLTTLQYINATKPELAAIFNKELIIGPFELLMAGVPAETILTLCELEVVPFERRQLDYLNFPDLSTEQIHTLSTMVLDKRHDTIQTVSEHIDHTGLRYSYNWLNIEKVCFETYTDWDYAYRFMSQGAPVILIDGVATPVDNSTQMSDAEAEANLLGARRYCKFENGYHHTFGQQFCAYEDVTLPFDASAVGKYQTILTQFFGMGGGFGCKEPNYEMQQHRVDNDIFDVSDDRVVDVLAIIPTVHDPMKALKFEPGYTNIMYAPSGDLEKCPLYIPVRATIFDKDNQIASDNTKQLLFKGGSAFSNTITKDRETRSTMTRYAHDVFSTYFEFVQSVIEGGVDKGNGVTGRVATIRDEDGMLHIMAIPGEMFAEVERLVSELTGHDLVDALRKVIRLETFNIYAMSKPLTEAEVTALEKKKAEDTAERDLQVKQFQVYLQTGIMPEDITDELRDVFLREAEHVSEMRKSMASQIMEQFEGFDMEAAAALAANTDGAAANGALQFIDPVTGEPENLQAPAANDPVMPQAEDTPSVATEQAESPTSSVSSSGASD